MARRKGNSEAFIIVASRMPWWLCVLFAVAAFVLLDAVATDSPLPVVRDVPGIGALVRGGLPKAVAQIGRIAFPVLLLIAALVSFIGQAKRRALADAIEEKGALAFERMTWQDFEMACSELFRRRGYVVKEATRGPDGGVDITLKLDGNITLAQCKHWRDRPVGVRVARELWGVVAARGAQGGILLSTSGFTAEAQRFAREVGLDLMDGEALAALVQSRSLLESPVASGADAAVVCPACGSRMVVRTAGRGSNVGQQFMGCSAYPRCRGTRPL